MSARKRTMGYKTRREIAWALGLVHAVRKGNAGLCTLRDIEKILRGSIRRAAIEDGVIR